MAMDVTVKDRYAAVIEQGLRDMGIEADAQDAAILLVQQLENDGIMPMSQEFRRGHPDRYNDEVFEQPPILNEGEFLLWRYTTSWMNTRGQG